FRKIETEYAVSAIPLEDDVKISGMIDESLDAETRKQPPQHWENRSKRDCQRISVILRRVSVSEEVGDVICIGITYTYGDTYLLKDVINENGGFQVGSVGEAIGLKTGDKIVAINGRPYEYLEELIRPETLLGDNAYYTVERNGQLIDIPIPHDFIQQFNKKESAGNFIFYSFPPVISATKPG